MVTIKDIAVLANVSVGTVDRVIHNRSGVSIKTKKRIEQILKENNFKLNMIARSLALKKNQHIAVLIPDSDVDNLFWNSPLMGIQKAIDEVASFGITVKSFLFDQMDSDSYLNQFENLINTNPDAVIFSPFFTTETAKIVSELDKKDIPYIFLNIDVEGYNNSAFIGQDSYKSGYLVGKLMSLCCKENDTILIPHIGSKKYNNLVIENRIKGFQDYYKDNKIQFKKKEVKFEDMKNLQVISKTLNELLEKDSTIRGVWIPSSRIATICSCIDSDKLKNLKLIGFDTTPQNIECLKNDEVTFLISQKSFNQGYQSIKILTDLLIQNEIPSRKIYSPIEIITKENLEFSQRNKKEFSSLAKA
ncbi:substrate-binding domain-containing protein [Lutibacter citreus]|uniref:substrate-binding domain-containing protein n=1 Tax=Lutibacter citreus TaxID=2138210 RepID=UPI000DBE8367|nr:substrate-binding domain-containing protein [Lutibacter citreus]